MEIEFFQMGMDKELEGAGKGEGRVTEEEEDVFCACTNSSL